MKLTYRPRRAYRFFVLLGLLGLTGAVARGDWLVTGDGQRIETRGPWKVQGRMIVFHSPAGILSSLRLSEVDLDASRAATEEAGRPLVLGLAVGAAQEPAPRAPILTLTDRDVARGEGGAQGAELLIERLQSAHRFQDVTLAAGLVQWQDTPPPFRAYLEKELEWLMGRQIGEIRLTEVAPEEKIEEVHDGVRYEPNVEVTHQMEIELVADDQDERRGLKLYVGSRLGTYFIAAARPVDE